MFQVRNEGERATVYVYGTIGPDAWDDESATTAREFARTLDALGGKPLDVRIDSLGGDVYEGFAIASAIRRYEGETVAHVDGVAASAASYVAVMADRVVMADFAQLMIHDAWTVAVGNASELMDAAAQLDGVDASIAGIIAARSGMEPEEVRKLMHAETWLGAEEAVERGMADEVEHTERRVAASLDRDILARFRRAPEGLDAMVHAESHAPQTIGDDEGRRLLVLGNHVYEEE